jgi:hypothetical protein
MKNHFVRNLTAAALASCALVGASLSYNASAASVTPSAPWVGYMNVFETPQHGGGYMFGSTWGTVDLCANWSGPTLTLSPNTIGDPNPYWYTPAGGPGSVGNKIMDANLYVEVGSFPGQTLTFEGNVIANTLFGHVDANGNGWTSVAFIKDFAPDYSSFNSVTVPLVGGYFNISMATVNDPARHVQYGFETIGPDVWVTDVGPFGNIQIVPEPGTLALAGLGLGLVALLRRRQ